jgi:hypothetical protein
MITTTAYFPESTVDISDYLHQEQSLQLLASYKGIHIKQECRLITHFRETIVLQLIPREPLFLEPGQFVYLGFSNLAGALIGRVHELDLFSGQLAVNVISSSATLYAMRQSNRVQPSHHQEADIQVSSHRITACISDICSAGVGMMVFKLAEKGIQVNTGEIVKIWLPIIPSEFRKPIKGIVANSTILGSSHMTRLGIRLFPTALQARQLTEYVTDRQQEILYEMAAAYQKSMEPRRITDLFF